MNGGHVAQTGAKRHICEVVFHIRGMDNIRTGAIIRVGTAVTFAFGNFGDQRLVVIDIPYNSSWVVRAERREQLLAFIFEKDARDLAYSDPVSTS